MDKLKNNLNRIRGQPAYGTVPDDEDEEASDTFLENSHIHSPLMQPQGETRYFVDEQEEKKSCTLVAVIITVILVITTGIYFTTNAHKETEQKIDYKKKEEKVNRGTSDLHPIAHHLDDLLFDAKEFQITGDFPEDLDILNTDITSLLIDEQTYIKEANLNHLGPHHFHVRYPKNEGDQYSINEMRKMCFYFSLKENEYGVDAAEIDLVFNDFKLEPGFDRIVLRHFNDSMVDPPETFSGKNYHFDPERYPNGYRYLLDSMHRTYSLFEGESKVICLEFQSDESVVDKGFDFTINLRYDVCEWKEWNKCYTMNLIGKGWNRGPFSNGKCGIGITHKHRTNMSVADIFEESATNGFVDCANSQSIGPEFCIKAPCSDWDNVRDPDFNKQPRYSCRNVSRYYNGRGRLDPVYADPFRLYLSQNRHSPFSEMEQNLEGLKKEIAVKMRQISDEHEHPNVLRFAIQDPEHKEQNAEYIGARVVDSLLIGRPFIVDMTGDSVASGHDNMFMSTFSMQLQSRLREFWVDHGVKGSTFQVRNIAIGGGYSTKTQGPLLSAFSTENHDFFSSLRRRVRDLTANESTKMIENDDHYRFLSAGYPIYDIDLHGSDNTMCDGGASFADRESHIRLTALLNGLWMRMGNAGGIKPQEACQEWESLIPKMSRWTNPKKLTKNDKYPFNQHYVEDSNMSSIGIIDLNAQMGMRGSCNLVKPGSEYWTTGCWVSERCKKTDPGAEINGELPEGQLYGYTSSWLMNNWHPSTKGHRLLSDIVAYWMLESAFNFIDQKANELKAFEDYKGIEKYLKKESGEWKQHLMNSIESGDIRKDKKLQLRNDMLPRPVYCGKPNGQCLSGLPFSLTSWHPEVFNTHSKLMDYRKNPIALNHIPTDLGWKLVKDAPSIQALEDKKGGPGWMDQKSSWQCDRDFFVSKLMEFAKAKKWNKVKQFKQASKAQLDEFHADLIEKELYLQFVVRVPLYGNGTVMMTGSGGVTRAYLAEFGDKSLGELPTEEDIGLHTFTSWQGLKPGKKYTLTAVPYNLTNPGKEKANCAITHIVAF